MLYVLLHAGRACRLIFELGVSVCVCPLPLLHHLPLTGLARFARLWYGTRSPTGAVGRTGLAGAGRAGAFVFFAALLF